jgi:IPT/TIG domain.
MSPSPTPSPRKANQTSAVRRYWARTVVIIYLILVLLVTGGIAIQAWPDNPLRQRLYVLEVERLAALQVTAEGIARINRALAIVARLPAPDEDSRPSQGDLSLLVTQLAFARSLQTLCPPPALALPANPLHWSRKEAGTAAETLHHARRALEQRCPPLVLSHSRAKPLEIYLRTFSPPTPPAILPRLTMSEQARVTALIGDMHNPPAAGEADTALDREIRPLLAKLQDTDFVLLILALGAWGASAQALASISAYLGRRRYNDYWFVFYLTRPFIGATLAFAFYIVFRGGLVTRDATWSDINHVGYAALAVVVGFFATEALENLRRIARGIFADKDQTDGLQNPSASLHVVGWIVEPSGDSLQLLGDGFAAESQVFIDDQLLDGGVRFIDSTEIRCDAPDPAAFAGKKVKVFNPGSTDGPSEKIEIPRAPTFPVIASATLSADGQTLTLLGRRFAQTVGVWIGNGYAPAANVTRVSDTQITVTGHPVAKGDAVHVVNHTNDGGSSNVAKIA